MPSSQTNAILVKEVLTFLNNEGTVFENVYIGRYNKEQSGRLKFTWRMIKSHVYHFFTYFLVFYLAFLGVNYISNDLARIVLTELAFVGDWKQMAFFLGIYISTAVKKASDMSSLNPRMEKLANLVSISVKNEQSQKRILKYVTAALNTAFSNISPLVHNGFYGWSCSPRIVIEQPEFQIMEGSDEKFAKHFIAINWALLEVQEAKERGEVDEQLYKNLIDVINDVHTNLDGMMNLRHETVSWAITLAVKISLFSFFIFEMTRILWTGLFAKYYTNLIIGLILKFIFFLCFLIIVRYAEQILKPYNDEHDVFELDRILSEKFAVNNFLLNKKFDVRKTVEDVRIVIDADQGNCSSSADHCESNKLIEQDR